MISRKLILLLEFINSKTPTPKEIIDNGIYQKGALYKVLRVLMDAGLVEKHMKISKYSYCYFLTIRGKRFLIMSRDIVKMYNGEDI